MRSVACLLALLVTAGTAAAPQTGADAAAVDSARRVVRALVETGQTAGVSAAVARGGRIVWTEGFGFADLERMRPATAATRFGIGSISKTLTMAVAVRLAERGALDLDAPVERYLPDFPHEGRGISVRRIAVHQSGLSDAFANAHYDTDRHFATVEEAYRETVKPPLEYEPGTRTVYATGTFTVVGRVIEAVTGRDYAAVMRDELFAGVGMDDTVPNDRRTDMLARTVFYANRDGGGFVPGPFFDPSHKLPGAGFVSTARDIAAFGAALLGNQVLGERGRREMFTPVPLADGTPTEWALGLRVAKDARGGRLLHLPGGGIGISTWIFIHRESDLAVALLANVNTAPVGGRTHRQVADAFLR